MSTNQTREKIQEFIHEYINHRIDIPSEKRANQPRRVENIDVFYFETGDDQLQVNQQK